MKVTWTWKRQNVCPLLDRIQQCFNTSMESIKKVGKLFWSGWVYMSPFLFAPDKTMMECMPQFLANNTSVLRESPTITVRFKSISGTSSRIESSMSLWGFPRCVGCRPLAMEMQGTMVPAPGRQQRGPRRNPTSRSLQAKNLMKQK